MGIDDRIARLPGGSLRMKGFIAAWSIVGVLAIPVFYNSSGRQGHDYLSSEKPEAIHAGQEELRKQYRQQRNQEKQLQQQQK